MPELPEIEATLKSFAADIEGATVRGVALGKPLRWPLGCEPDALKGLTLGRPWRRGKYLWLPLTKGRRQAAASQAGGLLIHLGMSGALRFAPTLPPRGVHDHFELQTSHGILRLTDPRRFGAVVWSASAQSGLAGRLLSALGHEPFDPQLTAQVLRGAWQGRRMAVKPALMAGDVVVGAGNIYACEALFLAGIDPRTPASRLSEARCQRLLEAVRLVLGRAIELGGTTLRNYSDAAGRQGQFQHHTWVYGREGSPCRRCGTPIRRVVQAQRSTFFCPQCQKR